MDSAFDAAERARIGQLVQDRFALSAEEAGELVGEAERMAAASVEWHGFTRAIKDGCDHAERVQLIEMLWAVAYADGALHDYEASLLRRITGLLYVPTGRAARRARAFWRGLASNRALPGHWLNFAGKCSEKVVI